MLAFPAARNIAPSNTIYQLTRRFLEALRTIPEIVYALIFVWAFGVGALAGILAIALHSAGANGKLFAEAIENADMKPWDGVTSAGGSWFAACRFAILPQVLPNILSYLLLRFEVNIRSASVIGFVGAGGISFAHLDAYRTHDFEVAAILSAPISPLRPRLANVMCTARMWRSAPMHARDLKVAAAAPAPK